MRLHAICFCGIVVCLCTACELACVHHRTGQERGLVMVLCLFLWDDSQRLFPSSANRGQRPVPPQPAMATAASPDLCRVWEA